MTEQTTPELPAVHELEPGDIVYIREPGQMYEGYEAELVELTPAGNWSVRIPETAEHAWYEPKHLELAYDLGEPVVIRADESGFDNHTGDVVAINGRKRSVILDGSEDLAPVEFDVDDLDHDEPILSLAMLPHPPTMAVIPLQVDPNGLTVTVGSHRHKDARLHIEVHAVGLPDTDEGKAELAKYLQLVAEGLLEMDESDRTR